MSLRASGHSKTSCAYDLHIGPRISEQMQRACKDANEETSQFKRSMSTLGLKDVVGSEDVMQLGHNPSCDPSVTELPRGVICQALTKMERHAMFRHVITAILWLNLVQCGASLQWTLEPWNTVWEVLEHFFTSVFAVEMVVKIVAHGWAYFTDVANVLDFVIAWVGISSSLLTIAGLSIIQLTAFRILRLFRAIRAARALKAFRQLTHLIEAIAASLASMAWIGVLMFFVIYITAILCKSVLDVFGTPPNLVSMFASVPSSMLTLFNMVLLTDWSPVIWQIAKVHPWMVIVFTIFIVFSNFGVMNVVIGIIVERASVVANEQREEEIREFRKRQMNDVFELRDFFLSMDTDNNHSVSKQEMVEASQREKFQELVRRCGLPAGFTLADLYIMLDGDGNGALTGQEFIKGMFRAVHNDDFQRSCMIHLCVNEVKQLLIKSKDEILEAVEDFTERMSQELHQQIGERIPKGLGELNTHVADRDKKDGCCQTTLSAMGLDDRFSNSSRASMGDSAAEGRQGELQPTGPHLQCYKIEHVRLAEDTLHDTPPTTLPPGKIELHSIAGVSNAEMLTFQERFMSQPVEMSRGTSSPLADRHEQRAFTPLCRRGSSEGPYSTNAPPTSSSQSPLASGRCRAPPTLRHKGPTPKLNLSATARVGSTPTELSGLGRQHRAHADDSGFQSRQRRHSDS